MNMNREPTPISDAVTLEELRRAGRQKRMEQEAQTAEKRATARDAMTPLGEGLRPWLAKRGVPQRCFVCGYSGMLREGHEWRGYCDCVWGQKARARDEGGHEKMVEALKEQHEANLRRKLVLPSAYTGYALESHPLAKYNPELHASILEWVETWDWHRGLILAGNFGRGKTSYVVSILQKFLPRAINERWGMLYTGGAEMLARLRSGFDDETYARTRDELSQVHLLVIDDLGASKQQTDWRQDQYLEIFEYRYANDLPTFVTTNLSDGELRKHLTERVYWRLIERCDLFDVTGPNLRNPVEVESWQS